MDDDLKPIISDFGTVQFAYDDKEITSKAGYSIRWASPE